MNTNEENKTEDRESGIQTYDRKKKSHGNFLKIGCASCGFVAVVALCVLSSRYSWFGVKADDEGISYNNGSELSYSTTAPVEEQKVPTKANKHNEAQETTVATSTTTSATTTAKTTVQDNATPAPVITDTPVNCSAEEAEVFRIVNEIRVSYGLKPYKWDTNAYKVAKARCSEIEQKFSHLRPDGSNFKTIYGYSDDELWYKFCSVGENLGSGQPTAQRVVDSWMASTKGHRENILNPDFENLAVAFGTYNDAYKYYWVQEFTTYR